jgi:putative hydroxymethylpyrimidine transport system permease protein
MNSLSIFLCGSLMGVFLLLTWQSLVWLLQTPDYILPAPLDVFAALQRELPILWPHVTTTITEILIGLTLGTLCGCLAGTILAYFRPLNLWFLPLLIVSQVIPTFAIAPLLVIWLGYGIASKVVTTVLMIFFPITSAFYDGLKNTPAEWLALAQTMSHSKWHIFWHVQVPAALPQLASGLRIAAVAAPIGAIVGEWVGASSGLGYLILNANARMQIDTMFATLFVVMIMALLLYYMVDGLLKKLIWW